MAPWGVFISPTTQKHKLLHSSHMQHHPGMVGVIEHKHAQDPNKAIVMPGIPEKADEKMNEAIKEEAKLLNKIEKMERWALEKDPLHQESRKQWLQLLKTI